MRNIYVDGTHAEALAAGMDIVQLKMDGWFCKMLSSYGHQTYHSDTDREFMTSQYPIPDGIYVGEMMRGTQWAKHPERHGKFFIFDVGVTGAYGLRYQYLRSLSPNLPAHFQIVQNYRARERDVVWAEFVEKQGYEGLVYRSSTGLPGDRIFRDKRVFTLDGIVIDIEPGQGKHSGRMGKLVVRLKDGTTTKIGNGYSDDQRQLAADHPETVLGRWMEFEANAVFASGNVRHGRFVRWREDKQ